MTGALPFVYIAACGCVFSHAGLKSLAGSSPKDSPKDEAPAAAELERQLELCPQCAAKYDRAADLVTINPTADEEERMRAAMDARRAAAAAAADAGKKSKKRKAAKDEEAAPAKKAKPPAPSMNRSVAAASRAVTSSLALEEAKRKAGMSEAVKELYGSKDGPKRKETFMTMGTFTRVRWLAVIPVSVTLTDALTQILFTVRLSLLSSAEAAASMLHGHNGRLSGGARLYTMFCTAI
jgi:hypothetical protein